MARFQPFSVAAKWFPNEPEGPIIKTAFPGPKTKESIALHGEITCNLQMHFPVDLQESVGNYVSDIDGNKFLDVYNSTACVGMGYNHPGLIEAGKQDMMINFLATRLGVGVYPPMEYLDIT